MTEPLEVRRDGSLVAALVGHGGRVMASYSTETIERFPGGTPVLSCSLPVRTGSHDATAWARGLLPEGRHLDFFAGRAGLSVADTMGLLAAYGRDVAGAYEIHPPGGSRREPVAIPYAPDDLAGRIADIDEHPFDLADDSELSLAGLQDKLLVVRTGDGWARPAGGFPSTHLMKLDHPRHVGLIDGELAALELARQIGLTSVEAWIERHGDRRVLVVERFDRASGGRVHQEDLLQALGVAPEGRAKYQGDGAGPPSWWHAAELLDEIADDPEGERRRLLGVLVFTLAIGNADGHAKNLALLLDGSVRLAPLYDTVPTVLWPQLRTDMAFRVGDQSDIRLAARADVLLEASRWRLSPNDAAAVLDGVVADLASASIDHEGLSTHVAEARRRLA